MKALGYGAKNTYNRYCFEESSPVANLFLDLKYMMDRDGRDRSSSMFEEVHHYENVYLLKNTAYLPLGFLAEDTLTQADFTESEPFRLQNDLFTAATGLQGKVWNTIEGDQVVTLGNGTQVTGSAIQGKLNYTECDSDAYVSYFFSPTASGFVCVNLDLPKRNDFVVCVNGVELYRETISLPQMLAVGDVTPMDSVEVRVLCDKGESGTMTVTAAQLDNDLFFQGYDILNASTLNITSFRQTKVDGTITCDRDGLFYTSVPQNGNWRLYVDGEEAQITLVGNCMISTHLTQGEHTIGLRYQNKAFSLGWKISLLSVAIFGACAYLAYKPELEKRKTKNG